MLRALVIACCILAAAPARADRAAAAELFRSGKAAYTRGDYLAAAHAFEAAHLQEPSAQAAFNAALAWQAAGQYARALIACRRALAFGQSDLESEADELQGELAGKTGELVVRGRGRVSVAHAQRLALPARIPLDPGVHVVTLERLDGKRFSKKIRLQPGERVSLGVKHERPAPTPEREHRGPQWALGWVFLGVGGAAGSTASFIGWQGLSARDAWVDSNYQDTSAEERALSFRTAANVLWIGAAALSVTGAVLVLTAP